VLISFLLHVCPIPFSTNITHYIERSNYLDPKEEVDVMGWGLCGGCGYSAPVTTGGFNFALIVVLFILLIIVGAVICSGY
jgi:uncharacterized protein (TIGR01732 family)